MKPNKDDRTLLTIKARILRKLTINCNKLENI